MTAIITGETHAEYLIDLARQARHAQMEPDELERDHRQNYRLVVKSQDVV